MGAAGKVSADSNTLNARRETFLMLSGYRLLQYSLVAFVLTGSALAAEGEALDYYVLQTIRTETTETLDSGKVNASVFTWVVMLDITVDVAKDDEGALEVRFSVGEATQWSNGDSFVPERGPFDRIDISFTVDKEGKVSEVPVPRDLQNQEQGFRSRYRDILKEACELLFDARASEKDDKQYLMYELERCTRESGPGWERYRSIYVDWVVYAEQVEQRERTQEDRDPTVSDSDWHRTQERRLVVGAKDDDFQRYLKEHLDEIRRKMGKE